jgi:hypothetical protein
MNQIKIYKKEQQHERMFQADCDICVDSNEPSSFRFAMMYVLVMLLFDIAVLLIILEIKPFKVAFIPIYAAFLISFLLTKELFQAKYIRKINQESAESFQFTSVFHTALDFFSSFSNHGY